MHCKRHSGSAPPIIGKGAIFVAEKQGTSVQINTTVLLGLALIVIGAVALFIGYDGFDFAAGAIGWVALILGALFLMFGLGKRASTDLPNPVSSEFSHGELEIRSLVQAMGSVVMADGEIKPQEVSTIANIHDQMLGLSISEDTIRDILSELGNDFDIAARLKKNKGKISPAIKRTIVQSSYLVMVSDQKIDSQELAKVHEIGEALGYSGSDIEDILALVST